MNKKGFIIRGFNLEDLNRVMCINVECLPENYSSYFYRDIYRKYNKTFIVAELEKEVQGYVMCRIEKGFSKIKGFTPTKMCHVVSIAVRTPFRRMGIATELMKKAMREAKKEYGASECYLEVRISNEPAVQLYQKLGFKKVKRNYGYYLDGEDAWVMSTRINNS